MGSGCSVDEERAVRLDSIKPPSVASVVGKAVGCSAVVGDVGRVAVTEPDRECERVDEGEAMDAEVAVDDDDVD